jgi:hypothetical protein
MRSDAQPWCRDSVGIRALGLHMGKAQCALLPTKTSQLQLVFVVNKFMGCTVRLFSSKGAQSGKRLCFSL